MARTRWVASLLLFAAATLAGCNHHRRESAGAAAPTVGSLHVSAPALDAAGVALVTSAVRAHLERFEADLGRPSIGALVTVTLETFLVRDGETYVGWCTPPDRIDVVAGDRLVVPALYHELWHLNLPGHDLQHEDPRWPEWDRIGAEVAAGLFLERAPYH